MALIMVWEESVKGRDEGRLGRETGEGGKEAPPFLFMQDRFRGQSVLSPDPFLIQSSHLTYAFYFPLSEKGGMALFPSWAAFISWAGKEKWVWLIKSRYHSCRFFTDPQKNRLNRFGLMIFRTWEGERGDCGVRGHSISAR